MTKIKRRSVASFLPLRCFVYWWSETCLTSRLSFGHEVNAARQERSERHLSQHPRASAAPHRALRSPAAAPSDAGEVFMFSCWSAGSQLWRFAYQGLWHLAFPADCSWRQARKYAPSGKSYRPMNAEGERPDRLLLSLLFHLFTLGPYQARHANTGVRIRQRHN